MYGSGKNLKKFACKPKVSKSGAVNTYKKKIFFDSRPKVLDFSAVKVI